MNLIIFNYFFNFLLYIFMTRFFFSSCSSHKEGRVPIDTRLVLKGQTLFQSLHNNNCRKFHFSLSVLFFVFVCFVVVVFYL